MNTSMENTPTQTKDLPIPYPDEFPQMVATVLAGIMANPERTFARKDGEIQAAIDLVVRMQNAVAERISDCW